MKFWKRLKNLWKISEFEPKKEQIEKFVEEMRQTILKNNALPPRPATIVQDELPDIFEENDTTTQ